MLRRLWAAVLDDRGAVNSFVKWVRHRTMQLLVCAPTLGAIAYFGLLASDRYVAEAQFVVRTASKPTGGAGLGAILQMTGLGRAPDEVFSVQSFLSSRNAVEQLTGRLPIREIFGRPGTDWIARYPSLFYGVTAEELHKYLGWMVTTNYMSTTGITTLRVQAFRAEDARNIALALLKLSEETVNKMNERIQNDAVQAAVVSTQRAQERLLAAQLAITRFRHAELMIDPAGSLIVITELIARLSADLTQTETLIREVSAAAAANPQLPSLRRRAEALQSQIMRERQKIVGTHAASAAPAVGNGSGIHQADADGGHANTGGRPERGASPAVVYRANRRAGRGRRRHGPRASAHDRECHRPQFHTRSGRLADLCRFTRTCRDVNRWSDTRTKGHVSGVG
jgi:BexC/CtrB/KpsE family polysaccharide export inner-membrane protein